MMKRYRTFVTTAVLFAALSLTGVTGYGQDCQPGLEFGAAQHAQTYGVLWNTLIAGENTLTADLFALHDQATYATLLADSRTIALSLATGRVVVTLPDGTVVLDTARPDDPTNVNPNPANSYQHFLNKNVNENHNSRIAILSAQMYPCGLGIEAKLSTTTGQREIYLARRLGAPLDSLGTARLSVTEQ